MSTKYYRIRDHGEDLTGFAAETAEDAIDFVRKFVTSNTAPIAWDVNTAEVVEWTNPQDGEGAKQTYLHVANVREIT
ncbi:hypothetical protein D1871_22515 [Nakamurella silvestris]|nr:hypothetical protein D1871_22515 [Nakamurella silvestris]